MAKLGTEETALQILDTMLRRTELTALSPIERGTGTDSIATSTQDATQANVVSGKYSAAFGDENVVTSDSSAAIGSGNTIDSSRKENIAVGNVNKIRGTAGASFVSGQGNNVYGTFAFVGGANNTVGQSGTTTYYQFASGLKNTVTGYAAFAHGQSNNVSGSVAAAIGAGLEVHKSYQVAVGVLNEEDDTKMFIVGNGTSSAKKNIFTVGTDGSVDATGDITDGSGNTLSDLAAKLPAPPSAQGSYNLGVTVDSEGNPTYSWVSA